MGDAFDEIYSLRKRVEASLLSSSDTALARPLLERILEIADEHSEDACYAHRHLAEADLHSDPWNAALHLRRVLQVTPDDDVAHALMGLCHALLGNFRAAVSSYHRALRAEPDTPWYHHNIGHLLDLALDAPREALPHLQRAYRGAPEHDEIASSLAHCLARLGQLDEAHALAQRALRLAPSNGEHERLLAWIESGAPRDFDATRTVVGFVEDPYDGDYARCAEAGPLVTQVLEESMAADGYTSDEVRAARTLWEDYYLRFGSMGQERVEGWAAAVEYAIARVNGRRDLTQRVVADRHGVAAKTLAARYGALRNALDLRPGDARYRSDAQRRG